MADIDITRIAGNIGAMNALNSLNFINKQLATHQTRLATGKRINSAADDPAGLSIATKMLARSEGLKVALGNIGDAKNLLAVAESGLGRINDILVQMRNKAAQAASDTMGGAERDIIKTQLAAFAEQIDDIVNQTKWNDTVLLNSTTAMRFQTGADSTDKTEFRGITGVFAQDLQIATVTDSAAPSASGTLTGASVATSTVTGSQLESGSYSVQYNIAGASSFAALYRNGVQVAVEGFDYDDGSAPIDVDFGNGVTLTVADSLSDGFVNAGTFDYARAGLSYEISASSAQDFANYLSVVEEAMNTVNSKMSDLGSLTGRLTFKEDQVAAAQINVESAYNRIMNANMAEEQVNASKYLILQQTATAMLAQANSAPQFLLSLFR